MVTALDYVQSRAKQEWEYTHSRGLFAWLFRLLGATRPVRGVWIQQYRDGNWDTVGCKGEVVRTWRYDDDGLTVVDEVPELDRTSAIASTTPVISFCVDEAAGRMIYHEWRGGRSGHGCVLARNQDGKWVIEKLGFKS